MSQQLDNSTGPAKAPMSFSATAARIRGQAHRPDSAGLTALLRVLALPAIAVAWVAVAVTSVLRAVFVWPLQRLGAHRQAVEDRGPHSVKHANIVT